MSEPINEEAIEQAGPKFDPPLYIQRYTTVRDILFKIAGIEKVVDFGCSEGKFIKYLKKLPYATEIACVDVLESSLYLAEQASRPVTWDFIFKRYKDLSIKIFSGSALEKDARLFDYDAVTCIELIEHLQPEDLKPLISNIFGFIHPKFAFFTTPNQEFNSLFPQVTGFRHWDHKFEWTQSQFTEWCESIIEKYPEYSFDIQGIGDPPPESFSLGCCTQLAVFKLNEIKNTSPLISNCSERPYKLIVEHIYPGRKENEA